MNTKTLIENLLRHPLLLEETAITVQTGYPYYICRSDTLVARFLLHEAQLIDGRIYLSFPSHMVEVDCRNGSIRRFSLENTAGGFVYIMDARLYLKGRREAELRLLEQSDALLTEYHRVMEKPHNRHHFTWFSHSDYETLSEETERYQVLFRETVEQMGVEELYASIYD